MVALLLGVSVLLIGLDAWRPGVFIAVRRSGVGLTHPVRTGAEKASGRLASAWSAQARYPELAAENERLRAQLAVVEAAPARQLDAAAELRRLLEASELDLGAEQPAVTAQVITNRSSPAGQVLEINKGSAAGVAEGMPIVTSRGLIGVATVVSPGRTMIAPITEPGSIVGVRFGDVDGGGIGLVGGQGQGRPLRMTIEPSRAGDLDAGDRLITSGLNRSLFPGNIPVGEVSSTDGEVRPYADLDDLSYVSVVLWRPEP